MPDEVKPEIENKKEDFYRGLYRLLLFYKQLTQLLESFFTGDLLIKHPQMNENYLRLCGKIEGTLEQPGFEDLARLQWRPFENLRALDPDAPDADWEYGGQQICGNFLSEVEETFIKFGEKTYTLEADDTQLLSQIKTYIERYLNDKRRYEEKWLQAVKKKVNEMEPTGIIAQTKLPQFDFSFIKDKGIKNLLDKDWIEVKKAFENGLYKSTIVLCGTIVESLFIDSLSYIEKEAKFSYYQKYLEGKDKGNNPPEIEYWQLYQLIEVAKLHGIISVDVAKFSHVVRDYRNLIHLFAQKRESLQINEHIASAVINLLAISYTDIVNWHNKKLI